MQKYRIRLLFKITCIKVGFLIAVPTIDGSCQSAFLKPVAERAVKLAEAYSGPVPCARPGLLVSDSNLLLYEKL